MRKLALVILGGLAFAAAGCSKPSDDTPTTVVPQWGPGQPRRVAFAPQGSLLAVTEVDGTVGVWDVAQPERPVCRSLVWAGAHDARFANDAKTLVTIGRDGALHFWDGDGRPSRSSTQRHEGAAHALAIGSDRIATGGDDGTIRVWNPDGTPRGAPLAAHQGGVLSVALSAQGTLASFGVDQTVGIWRMPADGDAYQRVAEMPIVAPSIAPLLPTLLVGDVHWGWGRALGYSVDGTTLAAAAFDGTVRFWGANGTPLAPPIAGYKKTQVHSIAFAPSGQSVAAAYHDGVIGFWRSDGKEAAEALTAHQGPVYSVAYDAASMMASAGADESVRLWGPKGERLGSLPAPRAPGVRSIAVAPNGGVIATGDENGVIRMWNLDGSLRGSPITAHGGAVELLAWSADGRALASAGADRVVLAWTVDGKRTSARRLPDLTTALAYSPDGQMLATVSRYEPVRLWQGEKLIAAKTPERMRGHTTSLAFSPDGTMIAGSSRVIQIWKVDGSSTSPQVEGPWGDVESVAFSPKGEVVAGGAHDGTVRLWNLDGTPDGEPRRAHRGPVHAVAFAPDGRLASGGEDGAVVVWPAGSGVPVTIDAGRPVTKLGFVTDGRLWVRGRAGDLRLFDRELRPLGELYFNVDGSVVISYDGWFSGEWPPLGWQVEVLRDGKPLGVAAAASHFSPERVRARLAVDGRGSAKTGS